MADEMRVAETVYSVAGEPFTDDVRSAIADYLQAHRRGRHGRVPTSSQMFGLDPDELGSVRAVHVPLPLLRIGCTASPTLDIHHQRPMVRDGH